MVWVRTGVGGELVGVGSLVLLEVTPRTSFLHSVIEGAVSPVGRVTALARPASVSARPVVVLARPFVDGSLEEVSEDPVD